MSWLKILLSCLSCLLFRFAVAQIESNSNRERNFAFEVKHIDEFVERFNNENDAFITKYVKTHYPGVSVDRKSLLTNLFNRQSQSWVQKDIDDFYNQVSNTDKPVYLDFFDKDWYAEASAKFQYNGKSITVIIILKIRLDENGGCRWMIESAYSDRILSSDKFFAAKDKAGPEKFINPMSHATNFMSLSTALNDMPNIRDYLDDRFFECSSSRIFLNALLQHQLKYQYVQKIRYHFLQVDHWLFTVDHFQRGSVNSGWLISRLSRFSDKQKLAYKRALLKIDQEKM